MSPLDLQELEQVVERALVRVLERTREQHHDPDELLTTAAAAQLLGLSASSLPTWRSRGTGPRYVAIGASIRYRRADLIEFLESRERDPRTRKRTGGDV